MAGKHLLEEPHSAGTSPQGGADEVAEADEVQLSDHVDPAITAREGVGMAHELGNDQDPASFLNG